MWDTIDKTYHLAEDPAVRKQMAFKVIPLFRSRPVHAYELLSLIFLRPPAERAEGESYGAFM